MQSVRQLKDCEGFKNKMEGRLRVATTVNMFVKGHLHISHGLTNGAVPERTVSFVDSV